MPFAQVGVGKRGRVLSLSLGTRRQLPRPAFLPSGVPGWVSRLNVVSWGKPLLWRGGSVGVVVGGPALVQVASTRRFAHFGKSLCTVVLVEQVEGVENTHKGACVGALGTLSPVTGGVRFALGVGKNCGVGRTERKGVR